MSIQYPALPYAENALEPFLSAKTLSFHYGKHFKTYVDTANKLLEDSPLKDLALKDIILKSEGPLFNNAAQAFNHGFYFEGLCGSKQEIPAAVRELLDRDCGGEAGFAEAFTKSAVGNFGSGWTWLVCAAGKLKIVNTSNAQVPFKGEDCVPLLVIDVWEHAYYLDYQNRRADYVKEFLGHVNWEVVAARLAAA